MSSGWTFSDFKKLFYIMPFYKRLSFMSVAAIVVYFSHSGKEALLAHCGCHFRVSNE